MLMNTLSVDECFLCNSGQYYMTWVIFKSDGRMSQPLLNVESPLWMHNTCTCSLGLKVLSMSLGVTGPLNGCIKMDLLLICIV